MATKWFNCLDTNSNVEHFSQLIAGLMCNDWQKQRFVCVHAFYLLRSFLMKNKWSNWIVWSLGNVFLSFSDTGCNFLDHKTFSTMRHLPPWDTLGCNDLENQTFSTMRHFPNRLFDHKAFLTTSHHEAFSTRSRICKIKKNRITSLLR